MSIPLNASVYVVLSASLIAAFTDVRQFKVYNMLTYPLCLSGLLYHGIVGGVDGFVASMTGLIFGFGVLLLPYMLGALGAGDVKFAAALGAWLGLHTMFWVFVFGAIASGVFSLALVIQHKRYKQVWVDLKLIFLRLAAIGRQFGRDDHVESVQSMAQQKDRRQRLVPFTAMITIGILVTVIWKCCT